MSSPPETAEGGRKFWFIWLVPGVSLANMWTYAIAAYGTIGLMTFIGIGTPYILNANLGIPMENQGQVTGDLQFLNEIVMLLAFAPIGVMADRIGRRGVYSVGLFAMAVAYFLYPLAESVTVLVGYRAIFAFGIAAATGMLGTILADYPEDRSRGALVAFGGVLNGLGVVTVALGLGRLPNWFVAQGYDAITAGRITHWIFAGLCAVLAVVVATGLQRGTPVHRSARLPVRELARSGLREARNLRILLSYLCAFIARSDLVIVGTFTVLWGQTAAMQDGLAPAQASAQGAKLFGTAQLAALLWLPIIAVITRRMNRVAAVMLCMGLASAAYLSMLLVGDPVQPSSLGWFILLGIGQISAFFGATTLISHEAPLATRGAVIGMFNACGALGVLISASIGGRLFDSVSPAAPFAMVGVVAALVTGFAAYVRIRAPGSDGVGGRPLTE
jgi:MFS family permease